MRVWQFPIEPIEDRYSADWLRWWPERLGLPTQIIMGEQLKHDVGPGEFLHPIDTHYFKATQLASFCIHCERGDVRDGDVVLLHDAWNAELTALAYMRDTAGPRFKIVGILHAGTWDKHDYLARCGLGRWAKQVEQGWFRALDAICVATQFHQSLLLAHGADRSKLHITGLPLYSEFVTTERLKLMMTKRRRVVFPHRLAVEKQPQVFDQLRSAYVEKYGHDGVEWVYTKSSINTTKESYYNALAESKVVFSSALQETWGIAMIEAVLLGCWPIAPKRLSYPETLSGFPLYENLGEAVDGVNTYLNTQDGQYATYDNRRWETAIDRVAEVITMVCQ